MHHIIAVAHVHTRIPLILDEKYFNNLYMAASLIILGDVKFFFPCSNI